LNSNSFSAPVLGVIFGFGIAFVPTGGNNPIFLRAAIFILAGLLLLPWALDNLLRKQTRSKLSLLVVVAAALMLTLAAISSLLADAPAVVTIYGWLGRADGLLTLIGVTCLFVVGATFDHKQRRILLDSILVGTSVALLIGVAQLLGYSPVQTAGYGGVSTTLGNPNFSGSFFGFMTIAAFWLIFAAKQIWLKALYALFVIGAAIVSWKSTSLQGPATLGAAFGISLVLFLLLTTGKFKKVLIGAAGLLIASGAGIILLTINGKGPLGFFANEYTIDVRKNYWQTAINMLGENPIFGVGPDSFQRFNGANRPDSYIELVGPDIMVSAAHSIPLQTAATLGIPAAILWGLIMVLPLLAVFYLAIPNRFPLEDKYLTLAIVSILGGYFVQSLISLDHIILKAVGWLSAGLVASIVKEQLSKRNLDVRGKTKSAVIKPSSWSFPVSLVSVLGLAFLVGAHSQALTPGEFSSTRAEEMISSTWVPCQIRVEIIKSLENQESSVISGELFADAFQVDSRCYELLAEGAIWSLRQGNLGAGVTFAREIVRIDPKNWRRQVLLTDALRLNNDPVGAKSALAETERLAAITPSGVDDSLLEALRDALYPAN
jgi:O-antigen ligase